MKIQWLNTCHSSEVASCDSTFWQNWDFGYTWVQNGLAAGTDFLCLSLKSEDVKDALVSNETNKKV